MYTQLFDEDLALSSQHNNTQSIDSLLNVQLCAWCIDLLVSVHNTLMI